MISQLERISVKTFAIIKVPSITLLALTLFFIESFFFANINYWHSIIIIKKLI